MKDKKQKSPLRPAYCGTTLWGMQKTTITENSNQNSRLGFTLIELLVTIGIAIVLLGAGISSFKKFGRQAALDNVSAQIRDAILTTRNLALAPESHKPANVSHYGISFDTTQNSYEIFEAQKTASGCAAARTVAQATISNPPQITSAPVAICFEIAPTAEVTIVGDNKVQLFHAATGRTKNITIDALSGQVNVSD